MADFSADLPSFRQSFPLLDIDSTMESFNQVSELNIDYSAFNYQSFLPNFSINDSLENLPGFIHNSNQSLVSVPQPTLTAKAEEVQRISKKRKALDVSESSSWNSSSLSPQVYETGIKRRNNSGRGKRAKSNENEVEKPKDVVLVRARRGQATDSHSLAERVRRGKINERLRCLQHIVPGCYKTMGMAVMLDEIINYVQSLQNQVEFLSMKLTEASTYCDSDSKAMERMQRDKAQEARELGRLMREAGYVGVGGLACFHSSSAWSSLT